MGAARQIGPGPNKQASPLTVDELKALHCVLSSPDRDVWDRNMAGAFLCCVYSRSRWSDMQHTNHLLADLDDIHPVYVELSITDYKTKGANAWRGGLLSVVAPAVGVTEDNWAAEWLGVTSLKLPFPRALHSCHVLGFDSASVLWMKTRAEQGSLWTRIAMDCYAATLLCGS